MFVWLKLLQFELPGLKRSARIVNMEKSVKNGCVIKSRIVLPIWHKIEHFHPQNLKLMIIHVNYCE